MEIRVLLVDDHPIVRDGLQSFLDAQPDVSVVGHASDGRDAVQLAGRLRPDVVVMDITLPTLNGIEALRQIRESCPMTEVVVLSMHATAEYVSRALSAGAKGYVTKESAGRDAVEAVYAVHGGHRYFSKVIQDNHPELTFAGTVPNRSPIESLSLREKEVMQMVVEGTSSSEAAAALGLSTKTVEAYRSRIMRKLGVANYGELIKFAIEHGLVPPA